MISNETKKITALDLIHYIGLPCLIYDGGEPVYHNRIEGVDIDNNKVIAEKANYNPEQIKPVLRMIEDIKVEESVYISCDIMGYDRENDLTHELWNQNDKDNIREFGFIQFDGKDSIYMPAVITYLLKQGFNLHLLPEGTYVEIDSIGKINLGKNETNIN